MDICSPDSFMFEEFKIHSTIFNKKNKNNYFMISSGTNQFPMPKLWKELLAKEIETDYLYRWYTSSQGFQAASTSLKLYQDFLCKKGLFFPKSDNDVCMTIGGSGAASLVFDFIKKEYTDCEIILVGYNYSLYERLAKKHHFKILELKTIKNKSGLPQEEDFFRIEQNPLKKVFIFTNPNNPSGDSYSLDNFTQIVSIIKAVNGYIILDQVCDLVISKKKYEFLESAISSCRMWDNCAIVNSFSKTDSTAGLRLGYIYGSKKLIKVVSEIQADSIMNPQTLPVFAIVITCMFRCLFLNDRADIHKYRSQRIRNLFRNVFFITSSIIPPEMKVYANMVYERYEYYYKNYVNEQLANERQIINNYYATIEILSDYIKEISTFEKGFNFCVWFNKPFKLSELELVRTLIEKTGVAILTESSFTLFPSDKNYFIRFSAACDSYQYKNALLRMKECFDKGGIFID